MAGLSRNFIMLLLLSWMGFFPSPLHGFRPICASFIPRMRSSLSLPDYGKGVLTGMEMGLGVFFFGFGDMLLMMWCLV